MRYEHSMSSKVRHAERPRVRASPASLRFGPWASNIYSGLVLVQPRKTRPCLTERLLMGRKESNQTNKHSCSCIIEFIKVVAKDIKCSASLVFYVRYFIYSLMSSYITCSCCNCLQVCFFVVIFVLLSDWFIVFGISYLTTHLFV